MVPLILAYFYVVLNFISAMDLLGELNEETVLNMPMIFGFE